MLKDFFTSIEIIIWLFPFILLKWDINWFAHLYIYIYIYIYFVLISFTRHQLWDGPRLFLLFVCLFFNWRLITLQYCGGFGHTCTCISHGCTCVPYPETLPHLPPHPIPQGHPSAPALSTLSHASNLDWWSISHMIIYMFQCYSLKSSHTCLLPQSPKVCSLHLCLFYCLAYRVIITIFLNFIYMHYYTVLVFFFQTYFTLYNRLQFHPPH